jgi:alpha-methylacyl-CoA racemase
MLLADLGADVVRIDRQETAGRGVKSLSDRGKRSLAVDLKSDSGRAAALAMADRADALIEGFRPGVMERLGLGPDVLLDRNPRLVYGRMTGWGQTGPLAPTAGHDINYIALTGALGAMGRADAPPAPPLNLVGDFGGGALYLAFGICAALLEARSSGKGQVIDCAMTDGAASLMTMFYDMRARGMWSDQRDSNLLDGGAYFYDVYACSDGRNLAIGAIEPQFHAILIDKLGLDPEVFAHQMNRADWPRLSALIAERVRTRTRDEWAEVFAGTDACVAPVLDMSEAPDHPHNQARSTFERVFDVVQPAPAPRFSRTPGAISGPPPASGAHSRSALIDWGIPEGEADALLSAGGVTQV